MHQKDFILFLIEQFARLVRKILAKITAGEHDDASFEIEMIYRQYLGINSNLINSFSYKYLMSLQSIKPELYQDRCLVLADVLALEGLNFHRQEIHGESLRRRLKSLNIYLTLFLEDEQGNLREHHHKVDDLVKAIEQSAGDLAPETRSMLTSFSQLREETKDQDTREADA